MRGVRSNANNLALIAAATVLVLAAPASAMAGHVARGADHYQGVRVDLHLDLGWYDAFGAGLRLEFPLVRHGPLTTVDNDLALSLGVEFLGYEGRFYRGIGVIPLAALQWNFYVSPRWSLFPELGLALPFGTYDDRYYGHYYATAFLGFGARFLFTPSNAFLLRLSWPGGLQFGITF